MLLKKIVSNMPSCSVPSIATISHKHSLTSGADCWRFGKNVCLCEAERLLRSALIDDNNKIEIVCSDSSAVSKCNTFDKIDFASWFLCCCFPLHSPVCLSALSLFRCETQKWQTEKKTHAKMIIKWVASTLWLEWISHPTNYYWDSLISHTEHSFRCCCRSTECMYASLSGIDYMLKYTQPSPMASRRIDR